MRSSLTLNTYFASLLLTMAIFSLSSASAQVIKVEPATISFGDMNQRETQTAIVTISNEGAGKLELGEVTADCGCTVPTLSRKELGPFESTTMEVQFNSKNFNGPVLKLVTIHSNDPGNPSVLVTINANILSSLAVDPDGRRLNFKNSPQGQVQKMPVTFTSVGPEPLRITVPAQSKKGLFNLKAVNGKDGNPLVSVVEVTIPANAKVGRHQDMGRVRTNISGNETVDLYFNSWITSELNLDIESVKFRFKKKLDQTITITPASKDTSFKVTGVEIDLPEIKVSYDNVDNGKKSQVHLTGKVIDKTDPRAISSKGRIKGTLLIHTDLKALPTIEVPISYMLRM